MEELLIKSFSTLIFASLGLGLILYFVKKKLGKNVDKSSGMTLKVVSRLNLAPKSSLQIIKVGDRNLLIGVTDKEINLIADLTEKQTQSPKLSNNDQFQSLVKNFAKTPINKKLKEDLDDDLSFGAFIKSAFSRKS